MDEIDFDAEVQELLESHGLPVSDIAGNDRIHLFGTRVGGVLSAVVGIEVYGENALIRSLAVRPEFRGSGIGRKLIATLEDWARSQRVTRLFLLTETADRFFRHLGYRSIPRSDAPEAIRETSEFSGVCPDSAEFMTKELDAD